MSANMGVNKVIMRMVIGLNIENRDSPQFLVEFHQNKIPISIQINQNII